MKVFMDIETYGLNRDQVKEVYAARIQFTKYYPRETRLKIDRLIELVEQGKVEKIVVWHSYIKECIDINYPELSGVETEILHDIYAASKGKEDVRFKIKDMTKELTGRQHMGRAKSDTRDLVIAYGKLNKINYE